MEGVEATARVRIGLDSTSKPSNGVVPARDTPAPQSFEWVQHGDATARRRARAHVTRGFRRQKAEQAQQAKAKIGSKSPSPQSNEPDEVVIVSKSASSAAQPYKKAVAKTMVQDIVLLWTLGSGRTDPFSSLPVKLDTETHALLDHFVFGVAPVSYNLDSNSDFNPVKALSFKVALADASAFHVLLSAGANDIAALHGRQDSEDAIKHRGISISLVNKRLSMGDASDRALAAVTLLAGNELLFGTPHGYNTHMTGLAGLLRLRGGLEPLRERNPHLYSWISWIDYAGSCNLVSRRRFAIAGPVANPLVSNPIGVPENLIRCVPAGYDLFEHMTIAFRRFEAMTAFVRAGEAEGQQVEEISAFLGRIDSELYRSICRPDIEGNRSRRQYIQQAFHLFTLMHAAMVSSSGGSKADLFSEGVEKVFDRELERIGDIFADLCRICVSGIPVSSNALNGRISKLVDACAALGWEAWRRMKMRLLEFFLTEKVCAGRLQTLWRQRIGTVPWNRYLNYGYGS